MGHDARAATVTRLHRAATNAGTAAREPTLAEGAVTTTGEELAVRLPDDERPARRAAGCLVAPQTGDRVLVTLVGDDCFVLSVLERAGDGDLALAPADGRGLAIAAPRLKLAATAEIEVATPKLSVGVGAVAVAVAGAATLLGRLMTVAGERLRTTVRRQETAADHLAAQYGERVTLVDGADVFSADTVAATVRGTMMTETGSAVTTAKHDLRFDAERVSVG